MRKVGMGTEKKKTVEAELEALKEENAKLKAELEALKEENAKLKKKDGKN